MLSRFDQNRIVLLSSHLQSLSDPSFDSIGDDNYWIAPDFDANSSSFSRFVRLCPSTSCGETEVIGIIQL